MQTQFNHFSIISRLFGNLFYRQPTDPLLTNIFHWLEAQNLSAIWPLVLDSQSEQALTQLQSKQDLASLTQEYDRLFVPPQGAISTQLQDYGINPSQFAQLREQYAMPQAEQSEHIALLLLTAAWFEDNLDEIGVQQTFFKEFLLPAASLFLGKVEAFAHLPFYRCLAQLCRDLLAAMADELEEDAIAESQTLSAE